ncbi:hypothetical protein VTN02DRAFT_6474 [Thermoascus thermophilus]
MMECYHCSKRFADRDEFDAHRQFHTDLHYKLQSRADGPSYSNPKPKTSRRLIFRGVDVVSLLQGKPCSDSDQTTSAVDTFQDALHLFPPHREQDGAVSEAGDIRCPDCEAVFSSLAEMREHNLTRYCPNAAVAVYVMTQDRLIKKGYRVEKKSIPLDTRPLRIPCGKCEELFRSEEDRKAHEVTHKSGKHKCVHCERECDTPYELNLHYNWHDDMEYRQARDDTLKKTGQNRISSITFSSRPASMISHKTGSGVETTTSKPSGGRSVSQRLSWPIRKYSQGDDGDLVAISFISAEDLERVYAPTGFFQEFERSKITVSPASQLVSAPESDDADCAVPDADDKTLVTTLCEEDTGHRNDTINRKDEPSSDNAAASHDTDLPRKRSLFRTMLGGRLSRQPSQTGSASNRGRKLSKKAAVQFSIFSSRPKINARATNTISREESGSTDGRESRALKKRGSLSDNSSDCGSSQNGSQGPLVHVRYHSRGAMVSDVSGRPRILSMDQVAQVYLQISEGLSSTALRTKASALRSRAEMILKRGDTEAAISEYQSALSILKDKPALDVDQSSRAAILHELGQAYGILNQAADSEASYLEALGLYRRIYGRDYPTNFAILNDLGILCERDGYATEAAELYERALAGRLKVLGPNAPDTLNSMQNLAAIKMQLGDLESALSLLEKAVPALETVLGLQNENTLTAMDNLSILYQKLGMKEQCRDMSRRMLPHCKTTFGLDSYVTRGTVTRCVRDAENFDFPPVLKDILDQYRHSRVPESLRVLHTLGRAYMDAGLNRDAAELFETLFEAFTAVKGVEEPETFDALSALCVARENLDWLEQAIKSYGQLLQIARRTPQGHHSRRRMDYAQRRVVELTDRRKILAAERKAWRLSEEGPCANCTFKTSNLCNTCNMIRFCSEACSNSGASIHNPRCIPSVTLRESKSIATQPRVPLSIQEQAIAKIRPKDGGLLPSFTATYTFYLDPRNFTTFRMKFSSAVNTFVLFCTDAKVRYVVLDNDVDGSGSKEGSPSRWEEPETDSTSTYQTARCKASETERVLEWSTPQIQEFIYVPCPSPQSQPQSPTATATSTYLLIAPGKEMLKRTVEKRVKARSGGGEQEMFEALEVPNKELIEYSQGLLLDGYLGEAFMYVFEWV